MLPEPVFGQQQSASAAAGRCVRRINAILTAVATLSSTALFADSFLLTGEVYSRKAQEIIVPLTTNWQARISVMAPEGSFVEADQVVVEFDGTEAARQLETQRETSRTERARTDRDLALLEKELVQAQFQLKQAQSNLDLASMKAEIPPGLIGGLEHAENQLALETAIKTLADAQKKLRDKEKDRLARLQQAEMDVRKTEIQEQWWAEMLENFKVRARQPGYVVYGNHPWTRAKFQEGDNVQTSFQIAQVADTSDLAIKVWINGVDRPRIKPDTPVRIVMDALPDQQFEGVLKTVSDSGEKRLEWGKAIYYEGIIELQQGTEATFMPGMSALVEIDS
jgi:multidrug resistance efflux pump